MGRTWRALLVVSALVMAVLPVGASQAVIVDDALVGLVDPATGEWHLRGPDGFTTSFFFGNPGDYPMMGDWDCDTIDAPGLYRQSDGYVYLRNTNTQGNADTRFYFGNPGDIPIAGDFNADGCDTVSIYRPSQGRVYIINELGSDDGGLGAADYDFHFGNPGDKPFVGDFNGDGTDTVGLHRESTGLVYFRNSNTQGIAEFEFYFGDPGDRLIAGDWNHDGIDSPGIFRPSEARMYLRYTNTQGNADEAFDYGISSMIPVAGNFGIDSVKAADRDWTVTARSGPVELGKFASLGYSTNGRAIVSQGTKTSWDTYQLAITLCGDSTCTQSDTNLEPWSVSDHTTMLSDASRTPSFSFHENDGGRFVFGQCSDDRCSTVSYSVVDPVEPPPIGQPNQSGVLSAMAAGVDGNPYIVYVNAQHNHGLWIAHCDDWSCVTTDRVRIAQSTGFNRFDIAVGIDGLPILVFYEFGLTAFELTARHCSEPTCAAGTESTVQFWVPAFDGHGFASIAIGTDDLPIIAYTERTESEGSDPDHKESLKAAHCNDLTCATSTTVTVAPEGASFVSMDIGGDGLPFIAYHTGGALKVAHCDNVACTSSSITTVDAGPSVGEYASLATDPLGMPMIAYYDAANHDLKIARLGS